VVIERVNNCIDFAEEAGSEFSEAQIMNHVLVIVAKTGLYTDDLKVWKKRDEDDKTWSEFQDFMLNAQTELRQQKATSNQMGYGMQAASVQAANIQAASMQVAAELFAAAAANSNSNATEIQQMLTAFQAKMEAAIDAKLALICQPVSDKPQRPPRIGHRAQKCARKAMARDSAHRVIQSYGPWSPPLWPVGLGILFDSVSAADSAN
jgi:hypothetical protein